MTSIVCALLVLIVIGGLFGCTVDRGNARYDRSTGYSDFRTEGAHGLETLDRPD
jgi:hypothetical protein